MVACFGLKGSFLTSNRDISSLRVDLTLKCSDFTAELHACLSISLDFKPQTSSPGSVISSDKAINTDQLLLQKPKPKYNGSKLEWLFKGISSTNQPDVHQTLKCALRLSAQRSSEEALQAGVKPEKDQHQESSWNGTHSAAA